MSDRDRGQLTPEEERARNMVSELPQPVADADFRVRLKDEFVSGTITETKPKIVRLPWYGRPMTWGLGIAAAAVLLIALATVNSGPAWEVQGTLPQALVINGEETQMNDDAVAAMLKPGTNIGVDDTVMVTMVNPGNLTVQLTPRSAVMLPKAPGRWFGRTVRAEVPRGEVRFTTGEDFAGGMLLVETPEAKVEILGTTVAVIREDFGTCVCVLEGTVRMGRRDGGPMEVIQAGRRRTLFTDEERPPFEEDILPMERMKLQMLRDSFLQPQE